jgi:hypothetical protein
MSRSSQSGTANISIFDLANDTDVNAIMGWIPSVVLMAQFRLAHGFL